MISGDPENGIDCPHRILACTNERYGYYYGNHILSLDMEGGLVDFGGISISGRGA
jgi:hypothetical protein